MCVGGVCFSCSLQWSNKLICPSAALCDSCETVSLSWLGLSLCPPSWFLVVPLDSVSWFCSTFSHHPHLLCLSNSQAHLLIIDPIRSSYPVGWFLSTVPVHQLDQSASHSQFSSSSLHWMDPSSTLSLGWFHPQIYTFFILFFLFM